MHTKSFFCDIPAARKLEREQNQEVAAPPHPASSNFLPRSNLRAASMRKNLYIRERLLRGY